MSIDEFIGALQTATQIFVWVEFSEHRACFVKTSKSAIKEFLKQQQTVLDDDFFTMPLITEDDIYAFKRDDELFIGAPPKDEEF